jgi:hypothetical protein
MPHYSPYLVIVLIVVRLVFLVMAWCAKLLLERSRVQGLAQVTGVRDPLVPSQGPVARFAVLEEDPVGESLARAESWLRAGIEAEPDSGGRIWALVMESASVPEEGRGQPEPWRLIRRLAPGRHARDIDG